MHIPTEKKNIFQLSQSLYLPHYNKQTEGKVVVQSSVFVRRSSSTQEVLLTTELVTNVAITLSFLQMSKDNVVLSPMCLDINIS